MDRRLFLLSWLGSLLLANLLLVSTSFGTIFNINNLYEEIGSLPLIYILSAQTINASETQFFNVSVWLESYDPINVTNYQIRMSVNDTIVSLTNAWLPPTNNSWIFYGENYVPLNPIREDYDNDGAIEAIKFGSTMLGPAFVTVTNPVLLGIVELHIQGEGITVLNISSKNEYSGLYETFIEDSNWNEIFVDLVNSQVEIYFRRVELFGDLNYDGVVDMQDIGIVAFAYGSYPGHSRWNPIADLNQDSRIDLRDIALTARHFGETYP